MIKDTKNDERTHMKTNTLKPITKDAAKTILAPKKALLATSLLTASLLISGCSNNDEVENAEIAENSENIATEDTAEQAVVDNTNTDDVTLTDDSSVQNDAISQTSMPNNDVAPLPMAEQPSLVTNPTEPGTPEDTVKQALNTLYYGDVEDAVGYYRVDMEDFETELANTQSAFQQTVESVTITNTQYSVDRIRATITGELTLKGQSEPAPLTYQLRKVGSEWKILG